MKRVTKPVSPADLTDDPALNTAEAAAYLGGIHVKTLNRLARTRQIEFIQLARGGPLKFRRSVLNEFLSRNTTQASLRA